MSHSLTIQAVVAEALAERGIAAPTRWVRKSFFLHHRSLAQEIEFVGGRAIWLAERNVVEVYDDQGRLLKAIALNVDERRAAA